MLLLESGHHMAQIDDMVHLLSETLASSTSLSIENQACNKEEHTQDDHEDSAEEGREALHHVCLPELPENRSDEGCTDEGDDATDPAEEGERLVLTNHAANRAHHLNTIANSVELGN